jgi:uncharacterized protein YjbI with pentapeptide repeats
MKPTVPYTAAATMCRPGNSFSVAYLAAFLTIIFASAAVSQTRAKGMNSAEEWVVAQVSAGEIADLSKQFPDKEKDKRKLSAHFLEELLMGALPGFKRHRNGVRIIGAIIDEPIDLRNARIDCDVWLDHCQFNSTMTFNSASFAGSVSFDDSAFKADANFNGTKVGNHAFFKKTIFEGTADFIEADIASEFRMDEAQFRNKEKEASFNSLKVGSHAWFRKVIFEGPVNFIQADIASEFRMDEAQFQNKEKEASFDSLKVGSHASFNKAIFEGPVNFDSANIAGNLMANETQFENKEQPANFHSVKVGHHASFNKAIFEGPVTFGRADIAGAFGTKEAKFQNKEKKASFNGMKVGGGVFFEKAVFEGPVDLISADVTGNFQGHGAKFQNKEKEASFNGMKVGGAAFFDDAVFEGAVDMRYADFAWLDVSRLKIAAQFYLQGTSYKYIGAAPEEPESHEALLKLADQSVYSVDVYSKLEEFFLRQGYRDDADRTFIAGKRRERKEHLYGLDWLGSYFLDWLVGYGRRPWQASIPCAIVVALGCVLFSPKKMEPQKPEEAPRTYSRFWYSLNLFLPVVDLQAGKVWKPKADQTFLRNYMRVHIMLGWILVPLVLAALTGLIK